jgi:hypothetical protein
MSAHPFCQTFSKTSGLGAAEKGAGGHRQGRRAWWCAWVRLRLRLATAGASKQVRINDQEGPLFGAWVSG